MQAFPLPLGIGRYNTIIYQAARGASLHVGKCNVFRN